MHGHSITNYTSQVKLWNDFFQNTYKPRTTKYEFYRRMLGYAFVTKAIYNRSPSLTLYSGCFPMLLTLKQKESKRKYHLTRPYAKALQTKPNSIKLSTVSQV